MPTWAEKLASTAAKAAVEACINGKGTGKGKGKNQDAGGAKGKASGKGTTSTNKVPLKPGQWLCDWAGCKWAIDKKPNHAYRLSCGGCSILRTDKPIAKQRLSTQQTSPSKSLKGEQAKVKAEESKRKAEAAVSEAKAKEGNGEAVHEQAIPINMTSKPLDLKEVEKAVSAAVADEKKVTFTQEQADNFKNLAHALQPVFDSLKTERRATPMRPNKDPAATADAFVKDSNSVTKGLELQKAEEEVTKLEATQGLFPESHPLQPVLKTQLENARALVTKLSKDLPSPDLRASCLEEIIASYKRNIRARKDRADKGREAAEARREERKQLVRKLRVELDTFEDILEELEDAVAEEYFSLGQDLDTFDEEVLELIQEKVDTDGAAQIPINKAADPLVEQLRKEKEDIAEKLRQVKAEAEKEAARTKEEKGDEEMADCEFSPDPMLLPTVTPTGDYVPALDKAWHILNLARWSPLAKEC